MIALSLVMAAAVASPAADSGVSMEQTRKLIHSYGDCIVRDQQRRASEAILANVTNSDLMRKYRQLIDGRCLTRPFVTVQARFQGDQYRYALADALVRKELAAGSAPDLKAVPVLDHRDPGEPPAGVDDKGRPIASKEFEQRMERYRRAQGFTYLSRYGECVVRENPAAARALLLTEPETAEEGQRFGAMGDALANCLAEGETLSFGRLALRGTIAVNYYRLAKAVEGAGATAGVSK